jgi:hypothetical protein
MARYPYSTARCRAPLRVLAVLLLADGRLVPTAQLLPLALPYRGPGMPIPAEIVALRLAGCRIETGHPPRYGYRLAALPPAELLDDVLLMIHEIQDEQPGFVWSRIGTTPGCSDSDADSALAARRSA